MLFFDGRSAKRAWPILGEYIRPKGRVGRRDRTASLSQNPA
jgi:hypothetical protein